MEFKGTKGKWSTFEDYGIEDEKGFSIASADNISIDNRWDEKKAYHWSKKGFHRDLENEEIKANALLISKAPELLDMLIKVVPYLCKINDTQAHLEYHSAIILIKESVNI